MKKFNTSLLLLVFLSIFVLSGCKSGKSNDAAKSLLPFIDRYTEVGPRSNQYTNALGTGYQYFFIPAFTEQDQGENVSFQYTFNTSTSKDIYFIFTNTSPSISSSYPIVSNMDQNISQDLIPETGAVPKLNLISSNKTGIRGKPEVSEFNRNPYAFLDKVNPVKILLNIVPSSGPRYDVLNNTNIFKIDSNPNNNVSATCRKIVTSTTPLFGTKTLNIWVANNCWIDSGTKSWLVNQNMVDALANQFLNSSNDDIYDWVTNIFGKEWGALPLYAQSDLISDTVSKNEITILLFDIDNDNGNHGNGGVLGYFWAKDNFQTSSVSYSNQRIMFYLDAVLLAMGDNPNPLNWKITDKWPSEIISTLAHEFQHMIHFYQKNVLLTNGVGTETWIDEMCSMATEDLVSDKLGLDGPRGVNPTIYTDGSNGPTNNTEGRLPLYNLYNDASVTSWYSGDYVLRSYAINYALGAYLARNYGGAKFFQDVVKNEFTDYKAIEFALSQNSPGDNFGSILQKWGISNLLSNKIDTLNGYRYNTNTWFSSNTVPVTVEYKVGSINLYNYLLVVTGGIQHGPYVYTTMPSGTMPQASNEYYLAANNLTGERTWTIKLKNTVRLTVLAK
jgi:hypothetical protein